jgi:hypothetical protein
LRRRCASRCSEPSRPQHRLSDCARTSVPQRRA